MSIVSNAGPLISLGRIGRLPLIPALYTAISIPPAVYQEVTCEPSMPGARELLEADWVQVVEVSNQTEVMRLRFWLDAGESEAIILAQEMKAILLMDERRGRTIAHAQGISFTGTVGILLAAKTRGKVTEVRPLLDALIANGIRLSSRLYREALILANE